MSRGVTDLSRSDGPEVSRRAAIDAAAARLTDAGVVSPRHDAAELAAHALGTIRSKLWRHDTLPVAAYERFVALVDERARRVPLQHLTGVAGFRHLELAVGPGVFIPRPETESLIDWGLCDRMGIDEPLVVDLCAGSGAIALSIADELRGARVHAVELDPLALTWAERNIATLGLPVQLHAGDATDPVVLAELDGTVDLVLSNPPYVPDGMTVEREVAEHDPALALWGGPDGMRVLAGIAARAYRLLSADSWFGVEHADAQGETVPALLAATGQWADIVCHRDLADRPRFTVARAVKD